jgi:hypothetical protein
MASLVLAYLIKIIKTLFPKKSLGAHGFTSSFLLGNRLSAPLSRSSSPTVEPTGINGLYDATRVSDIYRGTLDNYRRGLYDRGMADIFLA